MRSEKGRVFLEVTCHVSGRGGFGTQVSEELIRLASMGNGHMPAFVISFITC